MPVCDLIAVVLVPGFCIDGSMILRRMKTLFVVTLCVLLALTAQGGVAGQGASVATGQMVICTGTGTLTVYVDAQGQPTAAPHICPDCVLVFNLASAAPLPALATDASPAAYDRVWHRFVASCDAGPWVWIRGPPAAV